jgi:hypothetical protein
MLNKKENTRPEGRVTISYGFCKMQKWYSLRLFTKRMSFFIP